ncbi:hypothetical protein H5410_064788, partial [Solanum commersonii]
TQPLQTEDHPKEQMSSPSQSKMDKKGVHSPKNVEEVTVPVKGTSSPKLLSVKTKEVISKSPKPKPETPDTEYSGSNDYGSEYNPSLEQFAQDPNEDNDSGISFDSIALHNLDT